MAKRRRKRTTVRALKQRASQTLSKAEFTLDEILDGVKITPTIDMDAMAVLIKDLLAMHVHKGPGKSRKPRELPISFNIEINE